MGPPTARVQDHDATDGAAPFLVGTLATSCCLVLLNSLLSGQPGTILGRVCGERRGEI
jgi:hypothetical protein